MSVNLATNVFRQEILNLSAYKVADAKNLIKLDAMENPYSWPELIIDQWLQAIKSCPINRYPDPEANDLAITLRRVNRIPQTSAMLLGNGSDEIIQILLMALPPDASIMAPEPSFVMYRQIARSLGLNYHGIALRADDFALDLPAMLAAIENHQPAVIFLAYPNNPTGNLFSADAIEQILSKTTGLVVIDEAYAPFTDASFIARLDQFPNLLVMRTVSKLGLAGLRLGFLAGAPELVEQLNKIRLPYNINSLTQITANFALNNIEFLNRQTETIRQQRGEVFNQLNQFEDIKAFPSEANFILFKSANIAADDLFQSLKNQGILIKNLSPQGGPLHQSLRVTIGTEQENKAFIEALAITLNSAN
ncbi:histidinol-phosphate transaminase [Methylomarinum vadi]|uniref:histidinol-phosphate transaminase n=1 Tax=Methylomarinum vadi TaxID=438855 RepID=UPI0004DF267F|nr:histidinol-phosphate transaminase [Methylomarinum vadi]